MAGHVPRVSLERLYRVGLAAYLATQAPRLLARAVRAGRYREGLGQRLGRALPALPQAADGRGPIWLHAVSVGEATAARPLVARLRAARPEIPVVVSTVTDTGQAVARSQLPGVPTFYFPLDFAGPVARALSHVRPRLVVLMETELWPTFLLTCRRRGIPVLLANGRISRRSFARYARARALLGPTLTAIAAFCMQTREDAERIIALGADPARVAVLGNVKYDLAPGAPARAADLGLAAGAPLLVAGSTHRGEEEAVLGALALGREVAPGLRLLVAPRHPERAREVEGLVRRAGHAGVLRSALPGGARAADGAPVIVLDTVGELAGIYALATLAFVGGSLVPWGGHNPLEPAAWGCPVLFGPHMENFGEMAEAFLARGGAIRVADAAALGATVRALLADPQRRESLGRAAAGVLAEHRGAAGGIVRAIEALL
jgi:3-deoxy-D-manno-octulosonic-acid transferase